VTNTIGYPFPNNATTTGFGIYASSTIGDGTQTGGLTISGGATTTGPVQFLGSNFTTANYIKSGADANAATLHIGANANTNFTGVTFDVSGSPVWTLGRGSGYNTANYLYLKNANDSTVVMTFADTSGKVGIATSTPDATLQVQGSLSLKVTQSATTYTIATSTDFLVAVTSTASPRTVNLPQCTATSTASGLTDKVRYEIKDESGAAATNNITVAATFGQTIDGASTKVINTNYGIARVYCDGQVSGGAWFTY
jgi:hypothetical protein